jgi:hypothetical protein
VTGEPTDAPVAAAELPHRDEGVVVSAALDWFTRHQSADRTWGDVPRTGLAMLAFLGAGKTHKNQSVSSGLNLLRDLQELDGGFGWRESPRRLRSDAIAGLALVEAYGMTSARRFKEPAQRVVAFAMKTRTPSSGWSRPDGRLDFEATVWMSMLVKSAKMSQFDVDATALADAVTAIDQVTDPETGRVPAQDGGISSDAATAMGMIVRIFAGHTLSSDPVLAAASTLVREKRPDVAAPDLLYWYFGTLSAFQVGGETWGRWNRAMQTAILDRQRAEDDDPERGSWDPRGTRPTEDDRLWTTALLTLCTEARFRYPRLIDMQPK